MDLLSSKEYKKIVETMPLLCLDIIVMHKGKYLLVKRKLEPLKGQWWTPGGRVMKGETTEKALKRILKTELGIKVTDWQIAGFYQDFFDKSAWGCPTHTLSIVYEVEIPDLKIKLDKQSSEWKLFKELPERFENKIQC